MGLAGSGALSALPVVAALHSVGPGGALAVEEPEAGIDPLGQLGFASGLIRAALARRVDLVLATHSDYVVNGVLNMVHDGIIAPEDLGLYYFRRRKGAFTRVERIAVDRTGEAEQELFEEALDALTKGGRRRPVAAASAAAMPAIRVQCGRAQDAAGTAAVRLPRARRISAP